MVHLPTPERDKKSPIKFSDHELKTKYQKLIQCSNLAPTNSFSVYNPEQLLLHG